ncbi:hypothetical protein [Kitasatospora sp. NPDC001175]|uniref:hypothetical protein n=1 Tax=Kitasatospora sp. NPDC001175 TaxID=3157103 RepID=UPI003D001B3D
MGVIVPIVLFGCLAALVLGAPRFGPYRERRRAGAVSNLLTGSHAFRPRPEFGLEQLPTTPPFHYGTSRRLAGQVTGEVDGLPLTWFCYSCRENGSTHVYGVARVELSVPLGEVEVRHEPAFHSVRVVEPVPDSPVPTGVAAFDGRHRTYARDPHHVRTVLPAAAVRELLAAPEPFSWRVADGELLLWRSGGWSSAAALLGCVRAVTAALRPRRESVTAFHADRSDR